MRGAGRRRQGLGAAAAGVAAAGNAGSAGRPGVADGSAPGMVPAPPAPPKPILARITEKNVMGNGAKLIVSAGRKRGVAQNWTGQVFQGKTQKVIATFKITAVRDDESEGVTKDANLTTLGANDRVELSAPPGP